MRTAIKRLTHVLAASALVALTVTDIAYASSPATDLPSALSPAQTNITFGLESLGGYWERTQKPAVVTRPGRLDAFLIGDNGQLYHYWQGGSEPFQLESLGGSFKKVGVTAVSWEPYRLDVFAIGTDSQLYHYWQAPGMWYFDHESLGGYWPAGYTKAVSWGPGRLDVFLLGNDLQFYHYWYPHQTPTGTTFGLEALSGNSSFYWDIAAVAWPGRLDVFLLRPTGHVWHFWQNNGQPFYNEVMPIPYGQQKWLSVASGEPGRLDVFTTSHYYKPEYGADFTYVNHYWQLPFTGYWNSEIISDIEHGSASPVSAVSWGSPRLDVFTRRGGVTDPGLYHYWRDTGPSFGVESLGGSWNSHPSAVSWGWGRLDVFLIGDDGQLYHYWQG